MINFEIKPTKQFRKAFKRYQNKPKVVQSMERCFRYLEKGISFPKKYQNHKLKGRKKDFFECHIQPDVLLIYLKRGNKINLVDIGSHSEIFK